MSLVVAGGYIVMGSGDTYQWWDPTLSRNPGAATQDNKGCAPGWATIYVQDSLTGGLVKVCRRLDQSVLGPQASQTIQEEAGADWYDESIMSVASAAEQVVEGGASVVNALSPALSGAAMLAIALAVLLLAWKR